MPLELQGVDAFLVVDQEDRDSGAIEKTYTPGRRAVIRWVLGQVRRGLHPTVSKPPRG